MLPLDYPRKNLLVSTEWLFSNLNSSNLIIIDAGNWIIDSIRNERIPRSVTVPHPYLKSKKTPKAVIDSEEIEELSRSLGISSDSRVIVYDSAKSLNAARVWWVLNYYGISDVSILNGGFEKWQLESRPTTSENFTNPKSNFVPTVRENTIATVDSMMRAVDDPGSIIWDTRRLTEFTGENTRENARAGHVPNSIHLEWLVMMNEDSTFKSPSEIHELLQNSGISPDKKIFTY